MDGWTTICPHCGQKNTLIVISAILCANGKTIKPYTQLSHDGFETDPNGKYANLKDHSTEDEKVRCDSCEERFQLCDLTIEALAEKYGWDDVEATHVMGCVQDDADVPGGTTANETVIKLANGRELHCPAHPAECEYVRIVDHGHELMYWDCAEWEADATGVMGAIMGTLKSGDREKVGS